MPYVPKKIPPSVRAAIRKEVREPQVSELASHFFALAGGPRAVAKMLYDEFVSSKEGSIVRQRILDMMMRATQFANQRNAARDDVSMLTDEDLMREAAEILAAAPPPPEEEEAHAEETAGPVERPAAAEGGHVPAAGAGGRQEAGGAALPAAQ